MPVCENLLFSFFFVFFEMCPSFIINIDFVVDLHWSCPKDELAKRLSDMSCRYIKSRNWRPEGISITVLYVHSMACNLQGHEYVLWFVSIRVVKYMKSSDRKVRLFLLVFSDTIVTLKVLEFPQQEEAEQVKWSKKKFLFYPCLYRASLYRRIIYRRLRIKRIE